MATTTPKPKLDDTEYIVFNEPVTVQKTILNPVTGQTEVVAVQEYKEHRVPLAEWAEYERAHGWA